MTFLRLLGKIMYFAGGVSEQGDIHKGIFLKDGVRKVVLVL